MPDRQRPDVGKNLAFRAHHYIDAHAAALLVRRMRLLEMGDDTALRWASASNVRDC